MHFTDNFVFSNASFNYKPVENSTPAPKIKTIRYKNGTKNTKGNIREH